MIFIRKYGYEDHTIKLTQYGLPIGKEISFNKGNKVLVTEEEYKTIVEEQPKAPWSDSKHRWLLYNPDGTPSGG